MKLLLSIWLFALLIGCSSTNHTVYNIQGKIVNPELNGEIVYLCQQHKNGSFIQIDSSVIKNNLFSFSGTQDSAQFGLCILKSSHKEIKPITFILENGEIKMTLDTHSTVGGTNQNSQLQSITDFVSENNQKIDELHRQYTRLSSDTASTAASKEAIRNQGYQLIHQVEQDLTHFITENSTNLIGIYALSTYSELLNDQFISSFLDSVNIRFKSNNLIKPLLKRTEALKRTSEGMPYTDLSMKNLSGEMVSLSQWAAQDNYLLIDFWASWCPPCKEKIPELAQLYRNYKYRGFEIVGISLDNSLVKWENEVKEKNILWPQMSDLKGWKSNAVDTYNIKSIPYMILLDKEGKIVAKGFSIDSLKQKLTELYPPRPSSEL